VSDRPKRLTSIRLAGRHLRVRTNASDHHLARIVGMIEARANAIAAGKPLTPDTFLLVAMSFAEEAAEARARADRILSMAQQTAQTLLNRVESALDLPSEHDESADLQAESMVDDDLESCEHQLITPDPNDAT